VLDVVALGATVEMEDLTAPRRRPTLDGGGFVTRKSSEELEAERLALLEAARLKSGRREGPVAVATTLPQEVMLARRRKHLEAGIPSFCAEEFADLSDGRRVLLRDDRGWSHWPVNSPNSLWKVAIGRELTKKATLVLDPDDNEHWMKWVIGSLRFLGINVDPASVHAAPFRIEFGPRVQHELRQRRPDGSGIRCARAPDQLSKQAASDPQPMADPADVVALGAICEIEDLTEDPRCPKLNWADYASYRTPLEPDAATSRRRWHPPSAGLLAQRREMLESGRPQFYAKEFAELDDGRRILLKDDRGWSHWPVNSGNNPWKVAIGRELTKEALLMLNPVLRPGEGDAWIEWVTERLRRLGVNVDLASVHAAPFRIEFGPRVQHELRQRKPDR